MPQPQENEFRLLSPAYYNAPPGPPLALGAALAIWLFARAEVMTTLMAMLVAALVGIGYVRARREAIELRRALHAAEARLDVIEQDLSAAAVQPMTVEQLQAAAARCAAAIHEAAHPAPPKAEARRIA